MRPTILFLLGLALSSTILTLRPHTSEAGMTPELIGREYIRTYDSALNDSACDALQPVPHPHGGSGHTCVEWCNVFQGGTIEPLGHFCCLSDDNGTCIEPLG